MLLAQKPKILLQQYLHSRDRQFCARRTSLPRCCRREMLATSSSLHDRIEIRQGSRVHLDVAWRINSTRDYEHPVHRHRRLLRARRERPPSRAAEQRDELAPFHGSSLPGSHHPTTPSDERHLVHYGKFGGQCRSWVMNRPIGHVRVGSAYIH